MSEIRIDTPESVDILYTPAGLGSRFLAAVVDGLIQGGAVLGLFLTVILAGLLDRLFTLKVPDAGTLGFLAILLLSAALLVGGYKLLLEAFWNGQTVGKRVAGIRVVQRNGLPVHFWQVLVRNLLRVVDYLPAWYGLGAVLVLATRDNQRLGDLVAGTIVVRVHPAPAPQVPLQPSAAPGEDLAALRERVLRLAEADLEAARGFWQRRQALDPAVRRRLAERIAAALVTALGREEPLPDDPEGFIETVLYLRAHPDGPPRKRTTYEP